MQLAKEAVALEVGSGDSWYVLGNAYVASFFRSSWGIKDLNRALQAYKKAVRVKHRPIVSYCTPVTRLCWRAQIHRHILVLATIHTPGICP